MMATDYEVAQEINSSKERLTKDVDHAEEAAKKNSMLSYGAIRSYSDKVFDMVSAKAREIGDSIRDSYNKASDVMSMHKSSIGDISSSYRLQPAYASSGSNSYNGGHCKYC